MDEITEAMLRIVAERDYTKTLKDAAVEQLTIARQERDAAIAERDAARADVTRWHLEYQQARNEAVSLTALLGEPSELQKRVVQAEGVSDELRVYIHRYEDENGRLLTERDAARAEAAALREQVLRLRDACESVAQNMEASGQLWSSWHTSIAIARLRDALDMTASDNSSHVAP